MLSSITNARDKKLNDFTIQLNGKNLAEKQLIVYESETCSSCKAFEKDIMASWKSSLKIEKTYSS